MKNPPLGFAIAVVLVISSLACQRPQEGITVAGSTSVEPFAELLAEEYMVHHPGAHIYVQGGGSTAGIEAVRTGAADIGMSSRPLLPGEQFHIATIAKDAIAIIVHPGNPIDDLSLEQVRKLFSGKIRNWKELGGVSSSVVLVTREEGSGTREAFQKFVMGEEPISLDALVQDSNGAIRQVVADDPNAIGYISLGLVDRRVKALSLSGVRPTIGNIEAGKYPLVRPFLFVFNGTPVGAVKDFVEFVLSPEAQKLLLKEGLIPITSTIAKR